MTAVASARGIGPSHPDDHWAEAERRWADYERTRESVSLDDALAGLREGLEAHFTAKA